MPYKFVKFGTYVSGPHGNAFVDVDGDTAAAIQTLMDEDNQSYVGDHPYDDTDYTATELFAYGWVGRLKDMPRPFASIEQINEMLDPIEQDNVKAGDKAALMLVGMGYTWDGEGWRKIKRKGRAG